MHFYFTTFISLPTFKMPKAATCPRGSHSPLTQMSQRNSLPTPLTRWLLPLSSDSKARGRRQRQRDSPLPLSVHPAFFGIKITSCHFRILKETWTIIYSQIKLNWNTFTL